MVLVENKGSSCTETYTGIPTDLFTTDEEIAINAGRILTSLLYEVAVEGMENVLILKFTGSHYVLESVMEIK